LTASVRIADFLFKRDYLMKPINVGLLGLGTVGGGTLTVLRRNAEEISRRAGREIRVVRAAVRNLEKAKAMAGDLPLSTNPFDVVDDPEIDIVVELIGGLEPAKELVMQAIANGKHVVTANKHLVAKHGNEIFAAAQAKGVMVAFEAAVAGGIPIIKALREGLTANRIEWLAGIINGTSNFILTEMRDKGAAFEDVLKEAQALGYAEADPTFDIEGIDAAHKLTILSAIAFGIPMQFDRAYTEGISKLTREDVKYAEELGYRIKLLGIARRADNGIELRVHPTLIPERRLIANVDGAMNAVLVKGDAVGPTLYYGAGAGAEPTASAVVADLVDVTRLHTADPHHRVPHLAFQPDQLSDTPILPMDEVRTSYYLRLRAFDRPGVLADITRILADGSISIDAMVQKEPAEGEEQVNIILLTHITVEKNINAAITKIEALDAVAGQVMRIRLEELAAR
jgi:homoserine dehydrogenase